nr:reverse transcriptase domain-containing protein [Tanacetum cinerariifolium]
PRWENDPGKLGAASDLLRSKQPFILEESPIDTMADQRTMAELLRAPTEGYAEAIVVPSILADQFELKHSLINMMTTDQFFELEKDNPHDHIRCQSANECRNYRHNGYSQLQATPPPASVKAVEETCVTCGGAHMYYQCLAAGGKTFPKLRDNISGYVSAAAVNYNQEEDERVEETLTDPDLSEYTIKVPPPHVQKYKPLPQREYVVHQRDPLHPNIPYPSRMLKQTQQEKDELEEFADELALITIPPKYDDYLQFDIESDLKEIEYLLHHDPIQDIDSSLKDSIDQKVESDIENVYDDRFDSKGEKIKESKLLIDELDLPCDFPPSEYDSFISQDFSRVDALPSTNNEDKVFNPGILSQEKPFEIITHVVQDKKLATSNASSMLEDFDPPFYEPLFFKEVPKSNMLLPFSSKFSNQGFTLLKKFILLLS